MPKISKGSNEPIQNKLSNSNDQSLDHSEGSTHACVDARGEPVLKPFGWFRDDAHIEPYLARNVVSKALDISAGVKCVIELIQLDELEDDLDSDRPLFSASQRMQLLALAAASLDCLYGEASYAAERAKNG